MILLSELSRRRIRSIQKLIRVGRNEVVVVLRVDKDKGYIDLSKRRVSPEDIVKCEERYNKSKMVHSIMRHVAEKTQTPIEDIYQSIGWPLNKKYGHSIDAFKLSITNPEVWKDVTFPNDVVRDELQSYIGKRLTPQPTKVRSDIEGTHCSDDTGASANFCSHLLRIRGHRRRQERAALRRGQEHARQPGQGQARITAAIRPHLAMSRQESWHTVP
jgi:translation initiation factor 2 alpha subunit (eIF-2alpha)